MNKYIKLLILLVFSFLIGIMWGSSMLGGSPTAKKCPKTILINKSNEEWTKRDQGIVKRAQYVCTTRNYGGCAKKVIKNSSTSYFVICGKPNGK